jgi:superfamily II DNA or RNA helicase
MNEKIKMTNTFSDFYSSLDIDPVKRGKQFEHFVKWFLKADPQWATQIDHIWLWEEWPERWGVDCGIDLVFRHKNGECWAVQAKCYSPDYDITKHDVDKFLSESNRSLIQHRLLIATTDRIGGNAKQVCDGQEKPVVRFLLSDFERSMLEYPANFGELSQAKRKPPPDRRDHQSEAIVAVVQGLQVADRGQLIMACGTGKTYVTLWIKEHLAAERTLVLVPSLGLLSQLLREWTFAATAPFEVLCVCSDQTVGNKGNDEVIHNAADLAFPVTSDANEVKHFLSGAGNSVIFSTYQSSSIIAAAQADTATPAFDLVVADEAHRCAGKVGSEFTTILDNTLIRSTKRLFATATPRTYSSTVKKSAEERGVEVIGMDNASLFGEVLYALPFGKAIENKLLTDYRVVIIGVDDPTIAQWIANRELVTTNTGIETDSESLAAQIGLLKAIKDYDLKRIISFHSRVNRAEEFATDIKEIMAWVSDEHRPSGTLRTDFVSGNMPANKRKIKLDQLKALNANERGVLSNARCLSEGVDVPSLDGVAFIDPRSSQVDIIQAVGRAIRLSPDKKIGTIVLPVFIVTGEDATSSIETSHFKPIWDVLNALKAHDDVLAYELDQARTGLGKRPSSSIGADELGKISIDLPATVDHNFGSALRTHLVEQVTESWNSWFGKLQAYKEQFGHCNILQSDEGYRSLGSWVSAQRTRKIKGTLTAVQIAHLDEIGLIWNLHDAAWEEWFEKLLEFKQQLGHCNVVKGEDEWHDLAAWVSALRVQNKKATLSEARIERLNAIGFVWDFQQLKTDETWIKWYRELEQYTQENGNPHVPRTHANTKLASWVWIQRIRRERDYQQAKQLTSIQIELLDKLGFHWDAREGKWLAQLAKLEAFKLKFGHCNVELEGDKYAKLLSWLTKQREYKQEGQLQVARVNLLDKIGVIWESGIAWDTKWREMYEQLKQYHAQHDNSDVPDRYDANRQLAKWVSRQRAQRHKGLLSDEQVRLLDEVNFTWKLRDRGSWDDRLAEVFAFKEKYGHCNIPMNLTEPPKLSAFVNATRVQRNKGTLSTERIAKLDAVDFVWRSDEKRIDENGMNLPWKRRFDELLEYKKIHGDCEAPVGRKMHEEYAQLGNWVQQQRGFKKAGTLHSERIRLLDEIGFSWESSRAGESWDKRYAEMLKFKEEYGNCDVKVNYRGNPSLGVWVVNQRTNKKRGKLSTEQEYLLNEIGFIWEKKKRKIS